MSMTKNRDIKTVELFARLDGKKVALLWKIVQDIKNN